MASWLALAGLCGLLIAGIIFAMGRVSVATRPTTSQEFESQHRAVPNDVYGLGN